MIQNLIFVIPFLKILFRASTLVHTFQWTSSEYSLFQILWQKILKPIETSEEDHLFYNAVLLKKPHSCYESQLF